jgi:hypothetical protein
MIILYIIVIQIIKIIICRKNIKKIWIINLMVLLILLFLNIEMKIVNKSIENIDWIMLYSLRKSIVEKVIRKELNPNVEWNSISCELPFEFPIVSVGGNDISIDRYEDNTVTVGFYIERWFFEWPYSEFVYSNNESSIIYLEKLVNEDTKNSWKIKENWYRILRKN